MAQSVLGAANSGRAAKEFACTVGFPTGRSVLIEMVGAELANIATECFNDVRASCRNRSGLLQAYVHASRKVDRTMSSITTGHVLTGPFSANQCGWKPSRRTAELDRRLARTGEVEGDERGSLARLGIGGWPVASAPPGALKEWAALVARRPAAPSADAIKAWQSTNGVAVRRRPAISFVAALFVGHVPPVRRLRHQRIA
jgi:hypothetical protein